MPTTLLGLLLFVVLLAPGLTYSAYRAASVPVQKPSALRELGGIAIRSVIWDVVAIAALGAARAMAPSHTPDIGALARDPGRYAQDHAAYLFWWGVALLAIACLLGLMGAKLASWERLPDLLKPTGGVSTDSAWWTLFHENPGKRVYVGVVLDDDTYLGGPVLSYSPDSDETADRELTLTAPIAYRGANNTKPIRLEVGAVAVSARHIRYLTVTYQEPESPIDELP